MSTVGWFTVGTAGCTSGRTGIALSWTHSPHAGDMVWCIGDTVMGCVSDAVHSWVVALAWRALSVGGVVGTSSWVCTPGIISMVRCVSDAVGIGSAGRVRVSAPAWRTLGAGSVPGATSTSCTAAAVGFIAQLQCVGALSATCTVGRLVARTARHIGIGLSRACALRAGDMAGTSSASCTEATAGAVMQPHCIAVLVHIGAALSWSRAPGTGDVAGTSSASCVTAVARVRMLRHGGVAYESVGAVSIVGRPVMWVHGSGAVGDGRAGIPRAFCFLSSCSW
ncbi:hypothetical protein SCP_1900220 [Sparassis crispa]|uniref:Uncharacterized protein n=1 Tax=Sparassis crispa TaxID=139825 RepID=A0A401H714_9APHY|nr:hypothetical protein SCP_1900220 [Sparassis crispa]GBE90173.1 hypothetical protein SCP_1900220 [Sparassis crispa]